MGPAAEALAMVAALLAVFGVVLVKAVITVRARALRRQISRVDQEKAKLLGILKSMQAKTKVSGASHKSLEQKRDRLKGKLRKLESELAEYSSDAERRELQRERARGKLIRPTRAGTGGADDGDGAPAEAAD